MRTTVTLDDDLVARLKDLAHRTGTSFKDLLNVVLRRGLSAQEAPSGDSEPFRVETHHGGFRPGVDVGRLNQLVDELDVADFVDEARQGLELRPPR